VVEKNYLNANKELIEQNKFKPIDDILGRFNENLSEIDSNVYLVKHKQDNGQLQRCKIFLEMCQDYNFSTENLSDLLEGELILNKRAYQYLGKNLNFENIIKHRNYNKLKFKKSTIFYDNGIEIKKTSNENTLDIYQNAPGSRLYIINGEIENLKINFNGYKITEKEKELDLKVFPKNYPIDINGLTGCLSLINLKVKNVSIKANGSSCEDTVNFINVNGSFSEIDIKNSFSDGLDVDFSDLEIDSIKIDSSGNDCVDFSAGSYKLNILDLKNCGDKALFRW
jgi:DNA-binding protein